MIFFLDFVLLLSFRVYYTVRTRVISYVALFLSVGLRQVPVVNLNVYLFVSFHYQCDLCIKKWKQKKKKREKNQSTNRDWKQNVYYVQK